MGKVEITHIGLIPAPEGSMIYILEVEGSSIELLTLRILIDPVEASGLCTSTHIDLQNQLITGEG